jgi:hypothetical protein
MNGTKSEKERMGWIDGKIEKEKRNEYASTNLRYLDEIDGPLPCGSAEQWICPGRKKELRGTLLVRQTRHH